MRVFWELVARFVQVRMRTMHAASTCVIRLFSRTVHKKGSKMRAGPFRDIHRAEWPWLHVKAGLGSVDTLHVAYKRESPE